jgi:intracellular multiplication protein IcmG
MADTGEEEYKFNDPDAIEVSPENPDNVMSAEPEPIKAGAALGSGALFNNFDKVKSVFLKSDMRRNAIIVVLGLVGIIVLFSIFSKFISDFNREKAEKDMSLQLARRNQMMQQSMVAAPVSRPMPVVDDKITQNLSNVQNQQQNMNNNLSVINNKLNGFGDNINDMSSQISSLNQSISDLNQQLDMQSKMMLRIMQSLKDKKIPTKTNVAKPAEFVLPKITYAVQAVIPGRAWLLSSIGKSITVSEGSSISGYGVVNKIDAVNGDIVTSTGDIFHFNPEDS